MKWGSLNDPWGDQVKGSWWKAPLIIVIYFYLRLVGELRMIGQGYQEIGITLTESLEMTPEMSQQLMEAIEFPYFLLTLLLTFFVILLSYLFKFRFFHWESFSIKNVLKVFGLYLIGLVLQVILTSINYYFNPDYSEPVNQVAVEEMIMGMNTRLMFVNIIILTPIVEEYLLRGLIMKYTFPLMPKLGALVAAVFFALLHSPQNLIDFSIYFLLSMIMTGIYWYTRRLEYPIIVHMIQNLIGFSMI